MLLCLNVDIAGLYNTMSHWVLNASRI